MSRPAYLPEMIWMGVELLDNARKSLVLILDEEAAKRWAGEASTSILTQRFIWSVAIPEDTVIYEVESVPSTYKLKQVDS